MGKPSRDKGKRGEREAAAELELLNDFGPSDSDFIVQDIYLCLYEKPHASCFKSCTERLAGAV